jgi:hypothetical protein
MEPDTSYPDNNLRITLTKKTKMEPISIKIDVTKLDKTAFYKGEKGTYCTLVVWPNKNGEDKFGNYAGVKQDKGKDRRDEPSVFVGDARIIRRKQDAPAPKPQQTLKAGYDDADEVPF